MSSLNNRNFFLIILFFTFVIAPFLNAEEDSPFNDGAPVASPSPSPVPKKQQRRHYVAHDEKESRTDAGIFYVGFAAGGNFYIEPKINTTTKVATGEFFKDFGGQLGVYFDYDYSALTENVPLGIRGMLGYKYLLSSVHAFSFDAVARRMFRFSETNTFGVGLGGSAAIWYRSETTANAVSETIFLPSFIITAGFEFNPFMVDFKWLINRFQEDNTITGFELYFGVRL